MGSAQQRRRFAGPVTDKGQTRRVDLLRAARVVFERRGFLDTRIADIVEEAEVAQGTFYTYFTDKEAIFGEVARAVIDEMLHTLRTNAHSPDPYMAIALANRRFVNAYRPNARIIALIEQVGTFTPRMRALRLELREEFVDRAARGIRRLQRDGIADAQVDPVLVAEVLGAMVDHTCYVWLTLGKEFDETALLAMLSTVWARAIGIPVPAGSTAVPMGNGPIGPADSTRQAGLPEGGTV